MLGIDETEVIEIIEQAETLEEIPEVYIQLAEIIELMETQKLYTEQLLNMVFWFIVAIAVIGFLILLYNALKKFI